MCHFIKTDMCCIIITNRLFLTQSTYLFKLCVFVCEIVDSLSLFSDESCNSNLTKFQLILHNLSKKKYKVSSHILICIFVFQKYILCVQQKYTKSCILEDSSPKTHTHKISVLCCNNSKTSASLLLFVRRPCTLLCRNLIQKKRKL